VWHVLHLPVTTSWVWFHLLGFHALTVWQLAQLPVVGRWLANLPVAALPLWQLLQLVDVLKSPWSGLVAAQLAVVLWHDSQLPVTEAWMVVAGLPVAP